MTSVEFWSTQEFSYLATYSFNRGPKLAALHETTTAAIEQTERDLQQAIFPDQRKLERQLRILKEDEDIRSSTYNKKLTINEITSERIAIIPHSSLIANQLGAVFKASVGEAIFFMCPPIYRDALVFYDEQDKQVGILNICFECLFMETNTGIVVEADPPTYEALRALLIQLGHPIGDES